MTNSYSFVFSVTVLEIDLWSGVAADNEAVPKVSPRCTTDPPVALVIGFVDERFRIIGYAKSGVVTCK